MEGAGRARLRGRARRAVPARGFGAAAVDDGSARRAVGGPRQRRRRVAAASSCWRIATSRPDGPTRPTPATSRSRTPTWRSRATTRSSATSTASTIYDISNPAAPALKTAVVCPGGQGDVSVYGNLLFMSVEETRAKKDCTLDAGGDAEDALPRRPHLRHLEHLTRRVQVGGVQTCRGSHTHTLVRPKNDADNVYIYVSGTSARARRRPSSPAATPARPTNPNPSQWRIEVIKVPLAAPRHGGDRQRAAPVPRTRQTGARQRPAERAADAAAPVGHRPGGRAGHELLPRHHGLRGARPGRRRLRGQRPADRHLRPGQPEAHRRRRRPAVRLLARRDVLQRRQEGRLHRRVGRRHRPRAAARPTS